MCFLWLLWVNSVLHQKSSSLCNLCVLSVSVVNECLETTTTETQRLHREELSAYFWCKDG
jgi:hypothetical protein